MATKKIRRIESSVIPASIAGGASTTRYKLGQPIYRQGDVADAVFYIQNGKAQITAVSKQGKEGVIAILEPGEFFGEGCLTGQPLIEADLVDQLFNSSEKRLARVLLLLAHFGKDGKMEPIIPQINQEILAARVGTTRSRINHFMNKFRKLGFIEYNGRLKVHSALMNVILHD